MRPTRPATASGTPASERCSRTRLCSATRCRPPGCHRIFVDKASGKLGSRPALNDLLAQTRPGDTVVVRRLDRLGRSLRHLIEVVGDLERRGVAFISLTENIDPSTPAPHRHRRGAWNGSTSGWDRLVAAARHDNEVRKGRPATHCSMYRRSSGSSSNERRASRPACR